MKKKSYGKYLYYKMTCGELKGSSGRVIHKTRRKGHSSIALPSLIEVESYDELSSS
jgi:hypothetical protein